MAPAAASSSSSPAAPFNARNRPPTFTSGRQYSARVFKFATARAVAISNFSRYCGSCPASSALAWSIRAGTSSFCVSCAKKVSRFCRLSKKVTCRSGRANAMGSPGNPAPLPTSTSEAPAGSVTMVRGSRLSAKCFSATPSSSVMAVRFMRRFHSCSSVQYRVKRSYSPAAEGREMVSIRRVKAA